MKKGKKTAPRKKAKGGKKLMASKKKKKTARKKAKGGKKVKGKRTPRTPATRVMGQPPKRSAKLDKELLEHVADGETIRTFAKMKRLSPTTVYAWLQVDCGLLERLARAREIGALQIEDEILEIADTPKTVDVVNKNGKKVTLVHPDDVQHRKLQIHARELRLVWNNPAKYGKKTQVDVHDKREHPPMTDLERATRVRQLLEKAGAKVVEVTIGEAQPLPLPKPPEEIDDD